jgi:phosphoribosylformylglycinamidine synthase
MFCGLLNRQVLAGVDLVDVCLCDNFYTPHLSEHANEWLVGMVDELARLVRAFGTPVISGKDSSAGSTPTDEGIVHVPPAAFLSAMGKVPDARRLIGEEWTSTGNLLVRIGPECPATGGTVASRALGLPGTAIDDIDLASYRDYLTALSSARDLFRSATTIGPGGLLARLVSGSMATGIGVGLDPFRHNTESLFAEHRCGALVEIGPDDVEALPPELNARPVGLLSATPGIWMGNEDLFGSDVREQWSNSFAVRIM